MRPLRRSFEIEVIDGRPSESGKVTHFVECSMRINDHYEKRLRFFVTQLAYFPVVLGIPWLKMHDPRIGFASHTFTFDSEFCRQNCNMPERPMKVVAMHDVPARARPENLPNRPEALSRWDVAPITARACSAYLRKGYAAFPVTVEESDEHLS